MSNPTTTGDQDKGDGSDKSSDERKDAALAEQAQIIAGLHQQLAAEKAQHILDMDALSEFHKHALAAEREAAEQYKVAFENANDTCSTLREQLAAEREKVEELSTALRLLKLGASSKIDRKVAAVALAKIGEKC